MSIHSIGEQSIPYDPNVAESNQTVSEVQDALGRLGFSVPQNGTFSDQTEQALHRFQEQQHLNSTGVIDQPTIDALNSQVHLREVSGSQTVRTTPDLTLADRNRRTQELRMEGLAREGELRGIPLGEQHATAGTSGRAQVRDALQGSPPQQIQLRHSINEAARLLQNPSQGAGGWENRQADARVQMRSVADAFQRTGGVESYRSLPQEQREQIWRNLLMTDQVQTGQDILRSFRLQNPQVQEQATHDLQNAERSLRDIPRAQVNAPLHTAADIVQGLNQPTYRERAVAAERAATLAGDPRPDRPSQQDVNLYMRLTQQAFTRADLAAYTDEARRPGLHAFMAFMGAFPTDPSADGVGREAVESTITEASEHMEGPLFGLSVIENAATAGETYANFATPEGRFRHALEQTALDEAGGDEPRAQQIMQGLSQTGQQLQSDLTWLQRHPEHPSAPPVQDTLSPR